MYIYVEYKHLLDISSIVSYSALLQNNCYIFCVGVEIHFIEMEKGGEENIYVLDPGA